MTTDYRALCAELVELSAPVDSIPQLAERLQKLNQLADRARTLLDQPVAEGPTDDEIYKLALEGDFLVDVGDGFSCMVQDEVEFARAVLAKWGRPTPQPLAAGEVAETANQVKKPKKIQYHYSRHMSPDYADCETVQDAIGMAWADLENGDAWPTKITSDDQVLWTSVALATTESLVKFAKEWGMELPY